MNFTISYKNLMDTAMLRKMMKGLISVILVLAVLGMSAHYQHLDTQPVYQEKTLPHSLGYGMDETMEKHDPSMPEYNVADESAVVEPDFAVTQEEGSSEIIMPTVADLSSMIAENDKTAPGITTDIITDNDSDILVPPETAGDVNDDFPLNDISSGIEVLPGDDPGTVPVEPGLVPEAPDEGMEENVPEEPVTYMTDSGFEYDANGMIISCSRVMNYDGVLVFPYDSACRGVTASALAEISGEIFEIYIPANIVEIEPGALDSLMNLCYVEVQEGNPVYVSLEGELYYLDGTKF